MQREAAFASITRGRQWNLFSLDPKFGVAGTWTPNPEFDPVISYWVRDAKAEGATITIRDASGAVVRTLTGPAAVGLNRVTWDMRMEGVTGPERRGGAGRQFGGASPNAGPLVLPGTYRVSVAVPGVTTPLTGTLEVQGDPMDARFTVAQRRARQDALLDMHKLQRDLSDARAALDRSGTRADGAALRAEIDRLLGVTGTILRTIETFNSAPTADQRAQIAWASADARRVFTALNRQTGAGQ